MPLDLTSPQIIDWLAQFDLPDQIIAARLLSEILVVDAAELVQGLNAVILEFANRHAGSIALYTERHVRRQHGVPDRLYKENRSRPKRSFGDGPPPVPQGRPYARETGSEGLIATLITNLVRAMPDRFVDHPGPDQIRARNVRTYMIVTDFIGSGNRAWDNLEAAWRVCSFKSWWSYKRINFSVAAYAGTVIGAQRVQEHRSAPLIRFHRGCPTVHDLERPARESVISLCNRYGPRKKGDDRTALGYGDSGALIAFDHGIPNNAPLLLFTKARYWTPLFPSRSAALLTEARRSSIRKEEIDRALNRLREKRLAIAPRFAAIPVGDQNRILLLAALKRHPRTPLVLSTRTGLSVERTRF